MSYKVIEKFVSINGEGQKAGQLAVFVRFAGCNLKCSYCDTSYANQVDAVYSLMSTKDIYEYIKSTGVKNITLTGGEPLLQEGIHELLTTLSEDEKLSVEIETNGSVLLNDFMNMKNPPSFTMDYKLPFSNMESLMNHENFKLLTKKDTVKFVSGSIEDLYRAKEIIEIYGLIEKSRVFISPVFGKIKPDEIVDFMINNSLNGVNLQLQLHKIIWDPNKRGV